MFDYFQMKKTTVSTPFLSPFNGKTIVPELGREIGFKTKQELIKYLREEHAQISYILTASVRFPFVHYKNVIDGDFLFRLTTF